MLTFTARIGIIFIYLDLGDTNRCQLQATILSKFFQNLASKKQKKINKFIFIYLLNPKNLK